MRSTSAIGSIFDGGINPCGEWGIVRVICSDSFGMRTLGFIASESMVGRSGRCQVPLGRPSVPQHGVNNTGRTAIRRVGTGGAVYPNGVNVVDDPVSGEPTRSFGGRDPEYLLHVPPRKDSGETFGNLVGYVCARGGPPPRQVPRPERTELVR